ncbi:MAG: hypothetical protein OJF51_001962 [Nitrospira sp.]|nr:MAG: hypothetical protein OJF51_001962 [Nitrospira sp.]
MEIFAEKEAILAGIFLSLRSSLYGRRKNLSSSRLMAGFHVMVWYTDFWNH